jgi:HlyD family secretion protein
MVLSHGKGKKNEIFRQDALDRLSSPERLDQLMQIIKPADWIALVGLGGLIGCGVIWSIFGRIPVTVQGRGVFTQPRQVIDLQSTTGGQLQTLNISNGACVKKGDVLATIEPTELTKQLQLSNSKLAELRVQAASSLGLSGQRIQIERSAIDASRNSLQQRLQSTLAFSPTLQAKGIDAIDEQRRSLQQRLQDAQALVPVMQHRLETRKRLEAQGAIPKEALLQIEQEYIQARQAVTDTEAQIKQLDVQETQTEQQYLNNLQSATEVKAQLQELDTRTKRLEQEAFDTSNQWNAQITATEREIAQLTQQYNTSSRIVSAHDGCIVELTATAGQVVQPGLRLASVQSPKGEGDHLTGVTYFAVKDGKRIQPGMKVMITPDTIQRERFGGVVGNVSNVSALPVTMEGAVSVIGNPEVVKTLVDPSGAMIEVNAKLAIDAKTPSGFQWSSSQGPTAKITPGTTATALITLEERAPITFILPFLKELTGVQ